MRLAPQLKLEQQQQQQQRQQQQQQQRRRRSLQRRAAAGRGQLDLSKLALAIRVLEERGLSSVFRKNRELVSYALGLTASDSLLDQCLAGVQGPFMDYPDHDYATVDIADHELQQKSSSGCYRMRAEVGNVPAFKIEARAALKVATLSSDVRRHLKLVLDMVEEQEREQGHPLARFCQVYGGESGNCASRLKNHYEGTSGIKLSEAIAWLKARKGKLGVTFTFEIVAGLAETFELLRVFPRV